MGMARGSTEVNRRSQTKNMGTTTHTGQRTESQGRRVRSGLRGKTMSGEAGEKEAK